MDRTRQGRVASVKKNTREKITRQNASKCGLVREKKMKKGLNTRGVRERSGLSKLGSMGWGA